MLKTFTSNFKWLGEGDDSFLMVSAECKSESVSVRLEIENEFAAGNLIQHSCKDAGGKISKLSLKVLALIVLKLVHHLVISIA
jgi:hypothetical protein